MSNVLIGIIGVILFIGLALAGALILGTDFKTASSSSKAAKYISELNQISQAVNMYELKKGSKIPDDVTPNFLKPRFLSPSYQASQNYIIRRLSNGDAYVGAILPAGNEGVCAAIQEIYGRGNPDGTLNRSVVWTYGRPDNGSRQVDCVPYQPQANSVIIYKAL